MPVARLTDTTSKLDAAQKNADEAERQLKVLSNASDNDGDRVANLDKSLKATKVCAAEAETCTRTQHHTCMHAQ